MSDRYRRLSDGKILTEDEMWAVLQPVLDALTPEDLDERAGYGYGYAGKVSWISPSDSYSWEHYADSVVRVA